MHPIKDESWLRLARAKIPFERKLQAVRQALDGTVGSPAGFALSRSDTIACASPVLDPGVEADLEWLSKPGRSLVTLTDPDYPARLKEIARPPILLFCNGPRNLLGLPQLAIVGSRHPTPPGRALARRFARELGRSGLVVTSGFARGIDAEAHAGALAASGATIGVFATGPDQIYPRSHVRLAEAVLDAGGALITEFSVGVKPLAHHFPRRNRIISGLTLGTLVVEAALRSGSLITARNALEQGREVFAVPGSVNNPVARGCHHLLRQGAKLVETVDDIIEEFPWLSIAEDSLAGATVADYAPSKIQSHILDCMGYDAVDLDLLVERTGRRADILAVQLLELELSGLVCKSAGFFTRCPDATGRTGPATD